MNRAHSEIGPQLRALIQALLDRIEPTVRAAAMADAPGSCQQVWCPVCALAALVSDEQHPLLDVLAEHSVALLAMARALLAASAASSTPEPPEPNRPSSSRYQHIPIRVED